MVSNEFIYTPNEQSKKNDFKRLGIGLIVASLLVCGMYWILSYILEFAISEYLGIFAFLWVGFIFLLIIKFLNLRAALKPEIVLELLKVSSDTPKVKNTILNILKIQEKLSTKDLLEIKFILESELAELYVKNYRDLVGVDSDKESEIMNQGNAEIEIYTKSIEVMKKNLVIVGYCNEEERNRYKSR